MKMKRFNKVEVGAGLVGIMILGAGCVERRVVYVPEPQPAYAAAATAAPSPATAPAPTTTDATVAVEAPTTPPPPQQEVIPVAPGPTYVWTPGYWSWNRGWIWIGGRYVIRPHPHAVWVAPHYVRRGHDYVYVAGRWRYP